MKFHVTITYNSKSTHITVGLVNYINRQTWFDPKLT